MDVDLPLSQKRLESWQMIPRKIWMECGNFMSSIQSAANEGKESMTNTLDSTMKMSEKLGIVQGSIDENVSNLKYTVENINDLSAAMQDITSAADEINTAMRSAAEESEKISIMTQKILSQAKASVLQQTRLQ